MNLTPRRATASDGAGIATVYLRSTAKLGFLPRRHGAEDMWRHFQSLTQSHETWIVEHAGRIAAFLVVTPGEIEHLYVHPSHQGIGLGSTLLGQAKAILDNRFQLWTFCQNKQACRFYAHHGLKVSVRTDGRRNEEKLPDIQFVWDGERTTP